MPDFLSKGRFDETKNLLISSKNVLKQTKISKFSDVIDARNKNELKMMWLSKDTEVLDYFSPQKWKVNVFSM